MAKFSKGGDGTLVYLDFDFNDSRAAYKRAVDFVEKNSIKYSLSSNVLTELGGREIKSVPELFANDYVWSEANPGRVITKPQEACRLVFRLDTETSPLACENFLALCSGSKGTSKQSGLALSFKNTRIHRYHAGLGIIQGGDIQFGNGTGGESIWGACFQFIQSLSLSLCFRLDFIVIVSTSEHEPHFFLFALLTISKYRQEVQGRCQRTES